MDFTSPKVFARCGIKTTAMFGSAEGGGDPPKTLRGYPLCSLNVKPAALLETVSHRSGSDVVDKTSGIPFETRFRFSFFFFFGPRRKNVSYPTIFLITLERKQVVAALDRKGSRRIGEETKSSPWRRAIKKNPSAKGRRALAGLRSEKKFAMDESTTYY